MVEVDLGSMTLESVHSFIHSFKIFSNWQRSKNLKWYDARKNQSSPIPPSIFESIDSLPLTLSKLTYGKEMSAESDIWWPSIACCCTIQNRASNCKKIDFTNKYEESCKTVKYPIPSHRNSLLIEGSRTDRDKYFKIVYYNLLLII